MKYNWNCTRAKCNIQIAGSSWSHRNCLHPYSLFSMPSIFRRLPSQQTWFKWMGRYQASAELDDMLIIWIRCVGAENPLKHAVRAPPPPRTGTEEYWSTYLHEKSFTLLSPGVSHKMQTNEIRIIAFQVIIYFWCTWVILSTKQDCAEKSNNFWGVYWNEGIFLTLKILRLKSSHF